MFCNTAVECRHTGTPAVWGDCAQHAERLMGNWEGEVSNPPVISLEETSEGENDSHAWPISLQQTLRVLMVHKFGLILVYVAIHCGHILIVLYCILSVLCYEPNVLKLSQQQNIILKFHNSNSVFLIHSLFFCF